MDLTKLSLRDPINKFNLEDEWVKHGQLVSDYGELYPDAVKEKDQLDEKLTVLTAELELKVRAMSSEKLKKIYGLEKLTENGVSAIITTDEKIKEVRQEKIKAKHDVEIFKTALLTLEHRKKELDRLTDLWIREYYSKSKMDADIDTAQDAIRSKLNNKGA